MTYIVFDAQGVSRSDNRYLHLFRQIAEWQRMFPGRFRFLNLETIAFAAQHDDVLDSTIKARMEREMGEADNMLVLVSPLQDTESPVLNWQISRGVNRFHLPVVIAYAGLEKVEEDTIRECWNWLPRKFKKYITRYPWARMAHIPLTMDKLERALKNYSAERQKYPWDAETIF